jgi:hypothetical protein
MRDYKFREIKIENCLHVVGNINRIELIGEEAVAEMHPLLFAAAVYRHDT